MIHDVCLLAIRHFAYKNYFAALIVYLLVCLFIYSLLMFLSDGVRERWVLFQLGNSIQYSLLRLNLTIWCPDI